MGTSYSACPEEDTRGTTEGHWNNKELTISEIDSDSEAGTCDSLFADDDNDNKCDQSDVDNALFLEKDNEIDQTQRIIPNEANRDFVNSNKFDATTMDASAQSSVPQQEDNTGILHPQAVKPQEMQQEILTDQSDRNVVWGPPPVASAMMDRRNNSNANKNASEMIAVARRRESNNEDELESFFRELGLGEEPGTVSDQVSMITDAATTASIENDYFVPQHSRNSEWMGRSLESLVSGYSRITPILGTPVERSRRGSKRRGRRGSTESAAAAAAATARLDSSFSTPPMSPNGKASRKTRRRSLERTLDPFESPSMHRYNGSEHSRIDGIRSQRKRAGPNISLNLLAREATGKRIAPNNRFPAPDRLKSLGGNALYDYLDRPSAGMCSEVSALEEAIDDGDWVQTQAIIRRLSPRLIGDPSAAFMNPPAANGGNNSRTTNDPNLPPTAPRFYGGGGRIGMERDAFVLAGGIDVLVRVFREPCFVGTKMAHSYDARDLSKELVATNRLGHCWNETLACLRELVYTIPSLLVTERIFNSEKDDFLPFLFTLLSHDPFFDGAAALIEEILSLQSHSPPTEDQQDQPSTDPDETSDRLPNNDANTNNNNSSNGGLADEDIEEGHYNRPTVRVSPPTTFFLGNVPDLYSLWGRFNCRQLAHFCRILALLIFEPEDRQLLESPAVLKSIELLQLRRNRAARAGRDSTVDMNQSILLGDERLVKRFLDLLAVMNFAPPLRCSSPFHIMTHFPYIADTLMMLGLHEFENWDDIGRYEKLARKSLSSAAENGDSKELHDLGSVAGMLENLSDAFLNTEGEPTNQLGHIITVIGAAQQAGVVIGRTRQRSGTRISARDPTSHNSNNNEEEVTVIRRDGGLGSLASAAGILTEPVIIRRQDHSAAASQNESSSTSSSSRSRILTPGDAANVMQFNALLLAPYQVEVLFVLCTMLGGRRKIDAQELLKKNGVTRILEDMFQRLPWDSLSPTREPLRRRQGGANQSRAEDQNGIHGSGCECTPESALCVQYLRLLHNFCDRDCDNYNGRRLLLSDAERQYIFKHCHIGSPSYQISQLIPGLLSKVIAAFVGESDESPYRFWLASCVESYLRGSSSVEQVFVAKTGLIEHLIEDITSQRLHCAGSLQTSFDLLGELCKGNIEVLRLLAGYLDDEEKFRKLMSVAASNLVDSNVFIRSLLLSLERMSYGTQYHDVGIIGSGVFGSPNQKDWRSANDIHSRAFLTHSWWETRTENPRDKSESNSDEFFRGYDDFASGVEVLRDQARASDWFPAVDTSDSIQRSAAKRSSFRESCGRFGWVYKPEHTAAGVPGSNVATSSAATSNSSPSSEGGSPNTLDRLSWFLSTNRTRLLRDLLEVVNLNNINHENICCLNTAVVITIFANRRNELHELLRDLKEMDEDEHKAFVHHHSLATALGEDNDIESNDTTSETRVRTKQQRNNILNNFREVLWFWVEYYTHRGRDRLSLEFSSRLRFHEWMEVVTLLAADDGAPTALMRRPLALPQSPYQRIA